MQVAFFDTKPFERRNFEKHAGIGWRFHEMRLNAETAPAAQGADAVCVFVNDRVDRECLDRLREAGVRLVALRCAGFNNVDIRHAADISMPVVRVPAYSPNAVAEHTVALLLCLNRQIHRAFNRVRELNFSLNGLVGFDIHGKTAGILGAGKIGRITAQIFRGFGATVLAWDAFPDEEWAAANGIRFTVLEEILSEADIISLHTPLTPETEHLINDNAIGRMKRGVYLINTSRGKLINTRALIRGLKTGVLGGVCLDVYEEEEGVFFEDRSEGMLEDDELARLLTFPNVLITSHQGFLTQDALAEITRVTVANIEALASGRPFIPETVLA